MDPRAVGAEEEFVRAPALDGFDDVVELADAGSIRVDVGMLGKLAADVFMGAPFVGETAQVRDDEVHVAVLRGDHVDDFGFADDVDQKWNTKSAGSFADLALMSAEIAVTEDAVQEFGKRLWNAGAGSGHELRLSSHVGGGAKEGGNRWEYVWRF